MRLGKEQAAGYVEDTEVGSLPAEEVTITKAEVTPLAADPEPALPVT